MGFKKPKHASDEVQEVFFPKYSNNELDEFEKYLDTFRHEVQVDGPTPGLLNVVDIHKALVDFGGESMKIHAGVPTYSVVLEDVILNNYGSVERYKKPTKYDLFFDKWEQLKKLRGRQDFFDTKKTEAYAKMAEEIVVEPLPEEIPF